MDNQTLLKLLSTDSRVLTTIRYDCSGRDNIMATKEITISQSGIAVTDEEFTEWLRATTNILHKAGIDYLHGVGGHSLKVRSKYICQ